jgi:hypothetical protein
LPLIASRLSGGDNPPVLAAPGEDYRDNHIFKPADGEEPLLAVMSLQGRNFQNRPTPYRYGILEVNAMVARLAGST